MNSASTQSIAATTRDASIAHHSTKESGKKNKPLELSDIAWAGFGEFARQWLMLSRRKSYIDGSGEHQLYLRAGGSAGHSNLLNLDISEGVYPSRFWECSVLTQGEVVIRKAENHYNTNAEKVRSALKDVKEPMFKTHIRDLAGINTSRWKATFTRLVEDGILVVDDSNKKYLLKD